MIGVFLARCSEEDGATNSASYAFVFLDFIGPPTACNPFLVQNQIKMSLGCHKSTVLQERWAVPSAELAASKDIPIASAALRAPVAPGSPGSEAAKDAAATGPKRFLPFSTGPRQCALRPFPAFHRCITASVGRWSVLDQEHSFCLWVCNPPSMLVRISLDHVIF